MRIIIDAGHGGSDTGATGYGLQEKDITLDLAIRMGYGLEKYECEVIYTRKADVTLSLEQRSDFANQQKADFFLSIHVNASDGIAEGYESYVYHLGSAFSTVSMEVQEAMHEKIASFLMLYGCKNRGKKKNNFHVLRETNMPAVLVENLFIDNKYDAKLLGDEEFLQKLADITVEGLAVGLKLKTKTSPDWKKEAVEWLYAEGFLTSDMWKKQVEKPLPLWAVAIILRKMYEKLGR